jgi:subtilisin family serine protease
MGKYLIALLLMYSNAYAKDVRVMVIDEGISANQIELIKYVEAGSYEDTQDDNGHGTHVAGIIAESGCPNLKIVSCKAFYKGHANIDRVHECFERAIIMKVNIINYSGGGNTPDDKELEIIKRASASGIKINVAAGNEHRYLGSPCYGYWPACDNVENLTAIGSKVMVDGVDKVSWFSNYGLPDMKWEYGDEVYSTLPNNQYGKMSGTSMAAALYTRHMVQDMCYQQ